jgi:hypothetical protein
MKKQYIVPSMTVERFVPSNVIATSTVDYGGTSSDPGAPQEVGAPQRKGIWDE